MRFSVWPGAAIEWPELLDFCQHVERTGWDGIWIADHFMPNQSDTSGPTQEVWTVLAGLAALVPRVRLGPLVVGNTYRHPAVLAKQAAQIDIISGGRLVLGLGSAWQENEHRAYGIPFHTVGGRLRRLEEAVQVVRSLFEHERTTFRGRYYQLEDAPLAPKPLQRPLPILIGGGGEKVTLRITAQYAHEWNVWGSPEVVARKSEVLARHCEAVGRDPAAIRRSANVSILLTNDPRAAERAIADGRVQVAGSAAQVRELVGRYAAAGVDELVVPDFSMSSYDSLDGHVERRKEAFDRLIEEVAPAFR